MGADGIRSKVWQKTVAFDYDGVEPMVFCVFRKAEGAVMICVVKNAGFTKSNLVLYDSLWGLSHHLGILTNNWLVVSFLVYHRHGMMIPKD